MQWEKRMVKEEKAKLQEEISHLENNLHITRIMLRKAEKRLEKAEHDRDRYKRRIDVLQKSNTKTPLTKAAILKKEIENLKETYRNQIQVYKLIIAKLQEKQPRYIITPKKPNDISLDIIESVHYGIVEGLDNNINIIPTKEDTIREIIDKVDDMIGGKMIAQALREIYDIKKD